MIYFKLLKLLKVLMKEKQGQRKDNARSSILRTVMEARKEESDQNNIKVALL